MLFSSIPFLYYFLPGVLILYAAAPKPLKNTVLLLASLLFYAWGEPKYILLMTVYILNGYLSGRLIERFQGRPAAKSLLGLSAAVSIGLLAFFKYADFFIENFNAVTGMSVPLLKIALPIGISFYTFQTLSYTIDVYRGDAKAQRNFLHLATYIALFPQLIAGPIVRYTQIASQLEHRTHHLSGIASGIRLFVIGLAKKVLIANTLGTLCSIYAETHEQSVLFCWMYAAAYSLQVYFDFSGYSDMAVGLGKFFGFDFPQNFRYPFAAQSITDFWRRWHISLGTWFRDYVYIPLGGNRVSKSLWLRNILIVWTLTGFWHGAAWNFILWGLYFAGLLILEKLFFQKWLPRFKIFRHLYVLLAVLVSFVIFGASDIGSAWECIKGMFGWNHLPITTPEQSYYLRSYGWIFLIAAIGATPLPKMLMASIQKKSFGFAAVSILEPAVLGMLTLLSTANLVDGSFNPFLYFRF